MTKLLFVTMGPKLCKKVLQLVALDYEKSIKNLLKIANNVLIEHYDTIENENFYVEVYEKASSNSNL